MDINEPVFKYEEVNSDIVDILTTEEDISLSDTSSEIISSAVDWYDLTNDIKTTKEFSTTVLKNLTKDRLEGLETFLSEIIHMDIGIHWEDITKQPIFYTAFGKTFLSEIFPFLLWRLDPTTCVKIGIEYKYFFVRLLRHNNVISKHDDISLQDQRVLEYFVDVIATQSNKQNIIISNHGPKMRNMAYAISLISHTHDLGIQLFTFDTKTNLTLYNLNK